MKVYSIGRELGCDIVLNDNTNVISRRHAVLNVTSSGKMTIVDQSHNGTYVNGIRISPNVPVPVTRKDNISFAHIARLDWNLIPTNTNIMTFSIIGVIALLIIVGGFVGYNYMSEPKPDPIQQVTDSTKSDQKQEETIPEHKTEDVQEQKQEQKQKPHKEGKQKKDPSSKGQQTEKICPVCKKKISECEHKGKHPSKQTSRGDH